MKRTPLQKQVARDLVATLKAEAAKGGGKSTRHGQWDFMINGKKVTLQRDYESPPFCVRYGTYPHETKFDAFGFRERRQLDRLIQTMWTRDTEAHHNRTSSLILNDIIAPLQDVQDAFPTLLDDPVDKTAIKKAQKDLQKWVEN